MKTLTAVPLLSLILLANIALAQEMPTPPAPQKEHEWLKQFEGEWDTASEVAAGPGQPAMKCAGTMSAKMLRGFWIVGRATGEGMGMTVEWLQTIGYDAEKKKYVGTWIDSMWNHMWKYEGSVDESGKKLTLEAEGPNFMADGKTAKFRDSYEFKSPDHIAVTSAMQDEKGEWVTFMTGSFTKKK